MGTAWGHVGTYSKVTHSLWGHTQELLIDVGTHSETVFDNRAARAPGVSVFLSVSIPPSGPKGRENRRLRFKGSSGRFKGCLVSGGQ